MAYKQIFSTTSAGMKFSFTLPSIPKTPTEAKSLDVVWVDEVTGKVNLGLGVHPSSARAEKVLLDKVTIGLLTTIGSNNFDPGMGSFLTLIRRSTSDDVSAVKAEIALSLNTIKEKIKTEQSTQAVSPEQRLLDLKLSDVYIDPDDRTNLLIEVIVVTEANESYILTI